MVVEQWVRHVKTEQKNNIFCLMGPTASGKTALAVELVQKFPFEIISVDSAMVYRGMDIGTAKPGPDILSLAPHHLIDIRDPADPYSAADFRIDALNTIEAILQRGRMPLLVGGTMLYFHVLQQGLSVLPGTDLNLRKQLLTQLQEQGLDILYEQLQAVDPESARRIHPNDPQRVLRALEVYKLTGTTLTELHRRTDDQTTLMKQYKFINLAFAPTDRKILAERIALRFDEMLKQGLVEEVEQFFKRGDLTENTPAMRAVGYRQVWTYLSGVCSYTDMRERAVIATRQLAKRQMTWLRSWEDISWVNTEEDCKHKIEWMFY